MRRKKKTLNNTWNSVYLCYAIFIIFISLSPSGCAVVGSSVDAGDILSDEKIRHIQKGQTTRKEVLKLFGPPVAVFHEGKQATIYLPTGKEEISYELAFLPFSSDFKPQSELVIFYYQSFAESGFDFMVIAAGTTKKTIKRKRLWILLDEKKDCVVAYDFRKD